MKIGVINIGDELLSGKILNTNPVDLARLCSPLGHDFPYHFVIADGEAALGQALALALPGDADGGIAAAFPPVDFLVLTGGLGPTQDDLTRQALGAGNAGPLALQYRFFLLGSLEKRSHQMVLREYGPAPEADDPG